MDASLFDYHLPADRIAQKSVEPRDRAKMLVVRRNGNPTSSPSQGRAISDLPDKGEGKRVSELEDRHVFDLPEYLETGDLIVLNNSKVFKARLKTTEGIEIFLLRPTLASPLLRGNTKGSVDESAGFWLALAKPGRKLKVGDVVKFSDQTEAVVCAKQNDGTIALDFHKTPEEVFALAEKIGEIPVPPYVKETPDALEKYQTIYAETRGSVAAPTAGFHFTDRLFKALEEKGVQHAFVTLHVGLGTFRPMKTRTLEEHVMHEEWIEVPEETRKMIEETKKNGHRVIAIGTTTVRALESNVHSGFTKLFITPGFEFKIVDGLLTNFHLPKSTLLVLVSAFAGRKLILQAYSHAIRNDYRFYSFGDAMLIL